MSFDKARTLSVHSFDNPGREYRVRHVKSISHSGCQACKKKKVKCDEEKPTCRRCQRNCRQCRYPYRTQSTASTCAGELLPPQRRSNGTGFLNLSGMPVAVPPRTDQDRFLSYPLMHHMHANWQHVLAIPGGQELLEMSKSSDLLRSALLAVSACHLRTVTGCRAYQHAESFHLYVSISAYRERLSQVAEKNFGFDQVAELVMVATLLNIGAFALPASETSVDRQSPGDGESGCWVYNREPGCLGWLSLQSGLRPLMISIVSQLEQMKAQLGSIFLSSDVFGELADGENCLPKHWNEWFSAGDVSREGSRCQSGVYHAPLLVLAHLRQVDTTPSNGFLYLVFPAKIAPQFTALLYEADPAALWMVGYWMGLMSRIQGLWWSEQRATRDYHAICRYLLSLDIVREQGDRGPLWLLLLDDLLSIHHANATQENVENKRDQLDTI